MQNTMPAMFSNNEWKGYVFFRKKKFKSNYLFFLAQSSVDNKK